MSESEEFLSRWISESVEKFLGESFGRFTTNYSFFLESDRGFQIFLDYIRMSFVLLTLQNFPRDLRG